MHQLVNDVDVDSLKQTYSKYNLYISNKSNKSIIDDIAKLEVPDEIKELANNIYYELNCPLRRGRNRKRLLFYCIASAYHRLSIPYDPRRLAKLINIPLNDINRSIKIGSEILLRGESICYNALDFIPIYHKELGLDESILPDIINTANRILNNNPIDGYPQAVAAAIMLYYLTTHGYNVDIKRFAELTNRSSMTIKKIYDNIAYIDNLA